VCGRSDVIPSGLLARDGGRQMRNLLVGGRSQPGEFCMYAEKTNDYRRHRYHDRDGQSGWKTHNSLQMTGLVPPTNKDVKQE
jgi:hypothetical protein